MKNPVENGIEMVLDNVQQLRTVINRIRVDSTQSTNPLTMKLNGTLDAAVNGGVSKFEVDNTLYKKFGIRIVITVMMSLSCHFGVNLHQV